MRACACAGRIHWRTSRVRAFVRACACAVRIHWCTSRVRACVHVCAFVRVRCESIGAPVLRRACDEREALGGVRTDTRMALRTRAVTDSPTSDETRRGTTCARKGDLIGHRSDGIDCYHFSLYVCVRACVCMCVCVCACKCVIVGQH